MCNDKLFDDGKFFVNGEPVEGDTFECEVAGTHSFELRFPTAYKNSIQDPTDLSTMWEDAPDRLPTLEDITRGLIFPFMKSIESLKTEMVIPLGGDVIKIVYSTFGKLNDSDKAASFTGSYMLRTQYLKNLTFFEIRHITPGMTLAEKLKISDLQLVSNPLLKQETK